MINAQSDDFDCLAEKDVDRFLAENLGISANLIASVRDLAPDQTMISVPMRLIREQQSKRNRQYYTDLVLTIASDRLTDRLLPFRIVKSPHQ